MSLSIEELVQAGVQVHTSKDDDDEGTPEQIVFRGPHSDRFGWDGIRCMNPNYIDLYDRNFITGITYSQITVFLTVSFLFVCI